MRMWLWWLSYTPDSWENFVIISAASVKVRFEDIITWAQCEMFLNFCIWSLWCEQSDIRLWLILLATHFPAIFWSPWHAREFQDVHKNALQKGRKIGFNQKIWKIDIPNNENEADEMCIATSKPDKQGDIAKAFYLAG